MTSGPQTAPTRRARRDAEYARPRVSVVGVAGELLITLGVLVLAFVGWQVWLGDAVRGAQLNGETLALADAWERGDVDPAPVPADPAEPPVTAQPGDAERFAALIIPRFGADYYRPIAEGIGVSAVLNKGNIGHYPTTQLPGEVGNVGLASHRMSGGGNFRDLHQLRVGDHIFIETVDGWYQYSFRNLEYVQPTGVGVLNPVPQTEGLDTGERYLTMTTCNPFFSTAERLVAYALFDGFTPRADGPPAEIAATVPVAGEGN